MGFLLSIITEVKNDKNLEKYKDPLTEPLQKIKLAKYNRKNFDSSIAAVSQGIKAWVKGVEGKSRKVMQPLRELTNMIEKHMSVDMEKMSIVTKLENWQGLSGLYLLEVDKAEKALNGIDENLQNKISPKLQFIRQILLHFWRSVNNDDVISSVKELYTNFRDMSQNINQYITSKLQGVQQTFHVKFEGIRQKIETIRQQKTTHIQHIRHAVQAAQTMTHDLVSGSSDGIDAKYKTVITKKFEEIMEGLQKFTNDKTHPNSPLLTNFNAVNEQVRNLNAAVQGDLQNLKMEISGLYDLIDTNAGNSVVKGAFKELEKAQKILDDETESISNACTSLKVHYESVFKKQFEDLASRSLSMQKAIYGPGRTSVHPADDSLAGLITDLIASISVEDPSLGGDEGRLEKEIDAFMEAAKTCIQMAAEEAIGDAVKKFKVVDGKTDIDVASLMTLFDQARMTLANASSKIEEELGALKQVPQTVEVNKQTAEQTMNEVKSRAEEILQKIKDIEEPINTATEGIESAIKAAESSLQDARTFSRYTLQVLQDQLKKSVMKAFNDLESVVEKMFDTQKITDLGSLEECVTGLVPEIESIVEMDNKTGFKGLMNKLNVTFETKTLNVDNVGLDTYANRVKLFCTKFFTSLKSQPDLSDLSPLVTPLAAALSALLSTMNTQRHFDATVSLRLADLQSALTNLTPANFAEASPLLNVVKAGVRAFHGELAKQYVSRYSGKEITWVKQVANPSKSEPTEDALKCGKVFLSVLQPLFDGLHELRQHCANKAAWENKTISLTETAQHGNTITNPLGRFFQRCGYAVCSGPNKHNGELRNTAECRGGHIYKKLDKDISGKDGYTYKLVTKEDEEKDEESKKRHGLLKKLFDHLHDYYSVCHLPHFAARKYPCSVFDMLKWLCGLTSSTVYNDLTLNGFDVLFEKPKEEESEALTDFVVVEEKPASLSAYPYDITARKLSGELAEVCHYSQDVLTCLLGNGHSEGVYACDFNTNYDGFMYPSNMDTLLCMLREIVNRVYLQLHFLFQQCQYGTSLSGWLECEYGKDVGGSSWRCNTNQCADQKCKQIADQKRNQNCKLHPKCGVKSPLQSFLEDGLQGFLPHHVTYEKGKLECNVKSHSGVQCITPMGFADISHVASRTQTGHRIADVLAGFCGNQMSPLAKMCSLLNCAILSAPKTLGEMFAFYYGFLENWDVTGNARKHKKEAFEKAVVDANFGDTATQLDVVAIQHSSKHEPIGNEPTSTHLKGDLFSLVRCTQNNTPVLPCGPYLQSLESHVRSMCSEKHASNYLSWVVYLTETFYILLKKLYDECDARCGGEKPKCRISKCGDACNTKQYPGAHGVNHVASCRSIVQCPTTHPTLYKYGFTFGSPNDLSGLSDVAKQRTCYDFCTALKIVVKEGNLLFNLANKHIPAYLFTIREPFIWLNVALWSLSLFYLICVMVGRLDVLHIRSHLRSPSSHKISAQSLLAAAQVGRLAKISYLQP